MNKKLNSLKNRIAEINTMMLLVKHTTGEEQEKAIESIENRVNFLIQDVNSLIQDNNDNMKHLQDIINDMM